MKQIIVLISILIVLTAIIVAVNPKSHKEMQIVVTDFGLSPSEQMVNSNQNYNIQNAENFKQTKNIDIANSDLKTEVKNINVEQKNATNNAKTVVTPRNNSTQQKVIATENKINTTKKPVQTTQKNNTETKPVTTKVIKETSAKKEIEAPKPTMVQKPVVPTITQEQKARQEAIAWNNWRANVHNNIVSRVNLPIVPEGTVFRYSFTVTKDGTISSVKTTSTSPQYTAYAIQYIAPVIRSSQHAGFLRFPSGSERDVVSVDYQFRTTTSGGSRASANNFNDTEIIRR